MQKNSFARAAVAALTLGAGTAGTAGTAGAAVVSDFEDGLAGRWRNADTTLTTTVVPGGSQGSAFALRIDRTTGNWNQALNTVLTAAEWAEVATPGSTLSIDVKALGGAGNDVPGWWLQLIPTMNSELGGWDNATNTSITLDGQWRTYTITYPEQPAAPGRWSELFLINQGGAGSNPSGTNMTFYIDNVVVGPAAPVPEPTSLALLGVAGLALARRRRRA
jgi:hypothetical protein